MAIQVVRFPYYIRKPIYNKCLFPINVTKFVFSKSYDNKMKKKIQKYYFTEQYIK